MVDKEIKCIHCKSKNFVKQGFRKTLNRGKIQKYYCKECNKYFTADNGFYRMRTSETTITLSLYGGIMGNIKAFINRFLNL